MSLWRKNQQPVEQPRWDGTIDYVTHEYGGHPVPDCDDQWPEIDQLRWHAALAVHGTDIKLDVVEAWVERNGKRVYGQYAFNFDWGCATSYDFNRAWTYITGFGAGLKSAGVRVTP